VRGLRAHAHVAGLEPLPACATLHPWPRKQAPCSCDRTTAADIEFVRELELRPDNRDLIGSWSEAEHRAVIASPDSEHWIIEDARTLRRLGFLIALGSRERGGSVYLKRIVTCEQQRGTGRAALQLFTKQVFEQLAASELRLTVVRHNDVARRLYESLGFVAAEQPQPNENRSMTLLAAAFVS
jgi:diamine N-acetyltransferase